MTQEKIQQLSPSMLPRTIKPGQVKKFKLINAGAIDPLTNEVSYNSGATFEGIATVWDVDKNEPAIVKNITGKRLIKDKEGKDIIEEVFSPVIFDNSGMCYVDHQHPQTYVFLSRDNRCATNPFRDRSVEAVWEEIIETNIKERQQFKNNVKYDAMTFCRSTDTKAVMAAAGILADKRLIDVNLKGPVMDVRWAMEGLCETNPEEIIRASREPLPVLKLDIQDAVKYGEIEFQYDGNTWAWCKKFGADAEILKTAVGTDPIDELAAHLLKVKEEMAKKPKAERTKTLYDEIKDTLKELSVEAD